MKKSKILLPLTLAFVATASGAIAASNVKAAAEDTFKMVEGSSIQVRINQDTNKYGIKFAAEVGTPVEGATYNLMIVPVTYVDAYNAIDGAKKDLAEFMLDAKAANKDMPLAIATDLEVENGRIEGSIVDIRWENLSEQFVGAAYYTLADGTVKCAALATDGTRSVVDVATKALQSGDYAANETVTGVLKGFVYNAIQEKNKVSFEDKDVAGNEAKIVFEEATKSVYVGDTITVNYTPYVAADMATWSSTVESVATVENGVITAKAEGATTINVSLLDLTASYTLEVKKPTVANAKVEGATVSWDAIDGASYVVTLNGEAQPAQTENSFTLTQDGVYDISVAATKNNVTGEATVVAEDYMYTVDDISFANMKDVSYTSLNHNSGKITFTSDGIGSRKDSGIQLNKAYTNEFIKVTFEATGASMAENGIGLGLRGINSVSTVYDPLYTGGWALYPEGGNGGYFSTCYSDTAGNFHHAIDYLSGALGAVFETLNSGISLTSGFEKEVDYSYIYGAIGSGENTSVYFGIYKGDTLLNLYKWDWAKLYAKYTGVSNGVAYNYSSFPQIPDSGVFHIWSRNESARTLSYEIIEDATSILSVYDKPIVSYADGVLSWNTVGWAEGYKLSLDGGDTWKDVTAVNYELPSYGLYNVQLKAYVGETESAVSTIEALYTEDDIMLSNMQNVSFSTLNQKQGKITYTSTSNVASRTAATITLKKAYENQLIKVKFEATATSIYGNKLTIGFRQPKVNVDPLSYWSTGHAQHGNGVNVQTNGNYPLVYTSTYIPADQGGLGTTLTYDPTFNPSSNFVVGKQYYYVAGVIGKGTSATFYVGFFDSNDNPLHLAKWAWSDIKAQYAHAGTVADTGYFAIMDWSTNTTREISYEIIEDPTSLLKTYDYPKLSRSGSTVSWTSVSWAEEYKVSVNGGEWFEQTATTYTLSAYGLYDIKVKAYLGTAESIEGSLSFVYSSTDIATGKISKISSYSEAQDGTKTIKFTPDSTVTTSGYQSQSTASIAENVKYSNALLKVGFKAVSANIADNFLNISIRSEYSTVPNPVFGGSYNFFVYNNGSGIHISPSVNNKNNYSGWGALDALTVGNDYYMIAGIQTNADETRTLYFIVTEKQEDGSETLVKKLTWSFETLYGKTSVQIADEGYFVVSSWLETERTLTYKVITDTTEMNTYINM